MDIYNCVYITFNRNIDIVSCNGPNSGSEGWSCFQSEPDIDIPTPFFCRVYSSISLYCNSKHNWLKIHMSTRYIYSRHVHNTLLLQQKC